MHDVLRDRIWRHLEALPEERLYQVLDYIEFLSSKYARDGVSAPSSAVQAFGERLEDRLRAKRVGYGAIRGTLGMVGTADRFVSGLAEVGRTVLREVGSSTDATRQDRTPPGGRPEDIPVDG